MIPQRTPEWFAARKGRVTGSMVGAILGLSPYMTRDDALRSMVRASLDAPSEFTGNAATEWGTYNEAGAIAEFEMRTSFKVQPAPFVEHEDWLGASPDGLILDSEGLEVKCPYGIRRDDPPLFKTIAEQPHYYAQVQICLYVTQRSKWWFEQWTPYGTRTESVYPDQDWLDDALPRLRQFYAEYLAALADPQEHLEPKRKVIDTPDAHKMLTEWDELTEALERATERKKDLLAEMVALAGSGNALIGGRKLTSVSKAGSVSYAKVVKEKLPDLDLAPWTGKESQHWRLS